MNKSPLLTVVLFLTACSCAKQNESKQDPYSGYRADLIALRDTYYLEQTKTYASSGKAIEAARRIFNKINFIGMNRDNVINILGDPKTLNSYGIAADNELDSPFYYHFDTGWSGHQYILIFKKGVVVEIKEGGLY